MHPDHICFPLPLRSTSTLVTSPKTNEGEKKEKKYNVQAVLSIYSLEHGQIPSGQSLKNNRLQYKQWG